MLELVSGGRRGTCGEGRRLSDVQLAAVGEMFTRTDRRSRTSGGALWEAALLESNVGVVVMAGFLPVSTF